MRNSKKTCAGTGGRGKKDGKSEVNDQVGYRKGGTHSSGQRKTPVLEANWLKREHGTLSQRKGEKKKKTGTQPPNARSKNRG